MLIFKKSIGKDKSLCTIPVVLWSFIFFLWYHPTQLSAQAINLSLWPNISTQRLDTLRGHTLLNIGLNSRMNKLSGIGANVLGATTHRSVHGVQAAGLFNITKGEVRGIQLAGITNVTSENLWGVSLSGLVNMVGTQVEGLLATGALNIVGDQVHGIAVSGLVNIVGGDTEGVQLAGISNVSRNSVSGLQLSGLFNASGDVTGFQITSLLNVAGKEVKGLQLALANAASEVSGLQIGLFNYYAKALHGFQLGLINANPLTRWQLLANGGTSTWFNVGMRFKNPTYYTLLTLGTKYRQLSANNLVFTYRAGLAIPLLHQVELSGDLGFQHVETFRKHLPVNRLMNLQARLNLEYQLSKGTAIFLTGGYEQAYTYRHSHKLHHGFFAEIGTAFDLITR